ncbi:hypothetical protein CQA53_10220 [Helicobacter didelphidarum]|uniref:VgrG protein n=2 Tax=Helicobacter didelphidarum TaxID=2040648 RepID=A0A3D8I889_9HELI|nr:hypothetical protein CQA53_10220 [Helicobacter didelphidarum]
MFNTQSQANINADKGLYARSHTLAFQAENITSIETDSLHINAESDIISTAENSINLQIGDTTITATSDKIIFKAGGVEAILDANGLVVKGGEVKSE